MISQLRVGILPLEIESSRYVRKKLTERLCKLCHCNVEDEIHIDVGKNYMEQFIEVLCHSDLKTMASFIYEMWNARNNIIFQK